MTKDSMGIPYTAESKADAGSLKHRLADTISDRVSADISQPLVKVPWWNRCRRSQPNLLLLPCVELSWLRRNPHKSLSDGSDLDSCALPEWTLNILHRGAYCKGQGLG